MISAEGAEAQGYGLNYGDQYQFLNASEGITGSYELIIAPEGFRGRVLLSENNTAETLLIAPASYTQLAQDQNQINVARALDTFIPATSGDRLTVSTALDKLTASQYQQAFEAIQPTIYQSLGTIAFNLANAQNMELAQRLWGQRVDGSGFSMNGFADNTPVWEGQVVPHDFFLAFFSVVAVGVSSGIGITSSGVNQLPTDTVVRDFFAT